MSEGELILYSTEDGAATIGLRAIDDTVWLTQLDRAEWADKLDAFLSFNERDVLTHAGRLRMDVAQQLAVERFEAFDANRRAAEALAADEADIAQLEEMGRVAKKGRKKEGSDD